MEKVRTEMKEVMLECVAVTPYVTLGGVKGDPVTGNREEVKNRLKVAHEFVGDDGRSYKSFSLIHLGMVPGDEKRKLLGGNINEKWAEEVVLDLLGHGKCVDSRLSKRQQMEEVVLAAARAALREFSPMAVWERLEASLTLYEGQTIKATVCRTVEDLPNGEIKVLSDWSLDRPYFPSEEITSLAQPKKPKLLQQVSSQRQVSAQQVTTT